MRFSRSRNTFRFIFPVAVSGNSFTNSIARGFSCGESRWLTKSKISFSKDKSPHKFEGDEEQLNRVFINLLKNSIESINEKKSKNAVFKGKINVDIKEDSDYIYVTVVDNGLGFAQVDKVKMLTPYFTTKKKGTGLGLAIVTKIINDHNSTIFFNSIENGAKVEIVMPKKYD